MKLNLVDHPNTKSRKISFYAIFTPWNNSDNNNNSQENVRFLLLDHDN